MAHSLQNNRFVFKSNPNAFNFTDQSFKNFPKISIRDSINSFFPVGEVYFHDQLGIIQETVYFLEGLNINLKLGNDDDGYIENTFAWANNQLNDTIIANNLSGNNIFIIVQNSYFNNEQKTRSWNDTVSNVVENICTNDYQLSSSKKFISPTTGADYFYQGNIKTSKLLKDLANQAYSQNNPKSPYYTFFNLNRDFYFMTINEMFAQKAINAGNPYIIGEKDDSSINPYYVQDYIIQNLGVDENFLNYKIKTYKHKSDLSIENITLDYKDHVFKENSGKVLIRKVYQKVTRNLNLGLYDNEKDNYRFIALQNNLYKNSALPLRMEIVVPFNPKLLAGKILELQVESNDEVKGFSKEYSGKWLVTGTKHYGDEDSIIFSNATIAKSSIPVDGSHPYALDFLS